jgi:hypothetical protein
VITVALGIFGIAVAIGIAVVVGKWLRRTLVSRDPPCDSFAISVDVDPSNLSELVMPREHAA